MKGVLRRTREEGRRAAEKVSTRSGTLAEDSPHSSQGAGQEPGVEFEP